VEPFCHPFKVNINTVYCYIDQKAILLTACIVALAASFIVALPQTAQADNPMPSLVPPNIQVHAGNELYLKGHATGTQNYICLPSGAGFAWAFFGPQATLFDVQNEQIITHFLSPNPDEGGTGRATWQDSQDTSSVWAVAIESSSDPKFVAPGAIPWLKLEVVGSEAGPTGGDSLVATTYIQRLNTTGGVAPTTGCAVATDLGKKAFVPYTADYVFYTK
jgi:hypothetical protein